MVDGEITQRIEKRDGEQVIVSFQDGKEIAVEPHIRPTFRREGRLVVGEISATAEELKQRKEALRTRLEAEGAIIVGETAEGFEFIPAEEQVIVEAEVDVRPKAIPEVEIKEVRPEEGIIEAKPIAERPTFLGLTRVTEAPPPELSPERVAEIRRKALAGEKPEFKFEPGFRERKPIIVDLGEQATKAPEAFASGVATGAISRGLQSILTGISGVGTRVFGAFPQLGKAVPTALETVTAGIIAAPVVEVTKRGFVERGRELRKITTGVEAAPVEEVIAGDPVSQLAEAGTDIVKSFVERPVEAAASGVGFAAGFAAPEVIGAAKRAVFPPKPRVTPSPRPVITKEGRLIAGGRKRLTLREAQVLGVDVGEAIGLDLAQPLTPGSPGSVFFSISAPPITRPGITRISERAVFPHVRFRTRFEPTVTPATGIRIPLFVPPLEEPTVKVKEKVKPKEIPKVRPTIIPEVMPDITPRVETIDLQLPDVETILRPITLTAAVTSPVQETITEEFTAAPVPSVPRAPPGKLPPRAAPIFFPEFKRIFGELPRRRRRVGLPKKKYTPSVGAILLGLTTKVQPTERVFGLRPLIGGKKRVQPKVRKTKRKAKRKPKKRTKRKVKRTRRQGPFGIPIAF